MINKATIKDSAILSELAINIFENNLINDLKTEFCEDLNNENIVFFIKYINNNPIGFAQCNIRVDYVEGTSSSPVGYLEGIYIKEEYRCNGFAKELLFECEKWAKEKGCQEFASDCELTNITSLKFHLAVGFEEANRVICFKKKI
jgi:aminoglycoside 6'-N-acetyltransferase I